VRLDRLVDLLLPGDGTFPAASAAGVHERLPGRLGAAALAELGEALDDAPDRAAVERLERERPALFAQLLRAAYLTYYGSPMVAEAIRATGLDYRHPPQPEGYRMAPFDPARDAPRHRRGRFLATDEVRRVALPDGLVP
jgi:hypothetical protein